MKDKLDRAIAKAAQKLMNAGYDKVSAMAIATVETRERFNARADKREKPNN